MKPINGRGALSNPSNRYQPRHSESLLATDAAETHLHREQPRSALSFNSSGDVPFDRSVNPYRGCEHGCIYCYARPSHAWLDMSPGIDFETHIIYKPGLAKVLAQELAKPGYRPAPIALGVNTDAYQPAESRLGITREVLELLDRCNHPVTLITKGQGILRDKALLASMARRNLVEVFISITTLDDALKRRLEPRTANGAARLRMVAELSSAGVPCGVMAAPMIPAINDCELESILEAARDNGAHWAGYTLLRLPLELKQLFDEWLKVHYPDRAKHVLSLIAQSRGGRLNDPRFGHRMRGTGVFAELLAQRFHKACKRLGLGRDQARRALNCDQFVPPGITPQLCLDW